MRNELNVVFGEDSPRRVLEVGSGAVRGVHGVHETSQAFGILVRLPRLVRIAQRLLGDAVYVHQFKINAKLALVGDVWEWHQDYRFWHDEDGMPAPCALSIAIFLDEVNEFNGPLLLVPGSHTDGMYDVTVRAAPVVGGGADPKWTQTLGADLKYSLAMETLTKATQEREIVAPKGPAGSALIFHSNILHGSAPNMSPNNRTLVLVSYNSVKNALRDVPEPRPQFLASRNFQPLETVRDDALIAVC